MQRRAQLAQLAISLTTEWILAIFVMYV